MKVKFPRRKFFQQSITSLISFYGFSFISKFKNYHDAEIKSLEQKILGLMKKNLIPGLAISIIKEGEIFWSKALGVKNYQTKEPVNNNTVFAAASLSKPLFAYIVLKLSDRGKLNLDIPLTQYTKKPYINDPRLKTITARMVLSHTTGFPNWSGNRQVWIEGTPGNRFTYSGEGYLYLQRVIEEITDRPLHKYINDILLTPLGMNNTSYITESYHQYSATYGHDRQGNPKALRQIKEALSAGSLRTTAHDFAKFILAMINTENNYPYLLKQSTINEMLTPQINLNKSIDWGLGWGLEKSNLGDFFWHWGDAITFKSFALGSTRLKTGIVILTNSQNGLKICPEIVRLSIGGTHPAFSFKMIDY